MTGSWRCAFADEDVQLTRGRLVDVTPGVAERLPSGESEDAVTAAVFGELVTGSEAVFQVASGVGLRFGCAFDCAAEVLRAPAMRFEQRVQVCEVDYSKELRFAHGAVELVWLEDLAQVDQRALWSGARDASVFCAFGRGYGRTTCDKEPASPVCVRCRDFRLAGVRPDAPEGAGRAVAEDGVFAAREYGCEPPAFLRDARVPDRVDAPVDHMESAGAEIGAIPSRASVTAHAYRDGYDCHSSVESR